MENNNENDWWTNTNEQVQYRSTSEFYNADGSSLFDSMYNAPDYDVSGLHSISKMTLNEISEAYYFSLDFLGDFLSQLGCSVPIDINTNIGNLMNGDQIYVLLQALSTLDATDANLEYDTTSIEDLADEIGVSIQQIVDICDKEKFNLPYGINTILHLSIIDQIQRIFEYDGVIETDYKINNDDQRDDNYQSIQYDNFQDDL